uniref:Galaxin-like repeats domain-containing protein n=1 Tax=Ascaris lumbricoides TaxID=6252 RepID=A0A9J2P9L9_ASCLU
MLHFLHINDVSKINVEVISACCGDAQRCKNYTNIDELIAVSCCGHEPINQFTHICCQNTVRQRWHRDVYHERCCGNETISIKQTCCGNVVHNVVNGDCCGSQSFDRNDKTTLCCDGMLTRTFVTGSICCGREAYDGGVSEICCGGRVFQKSHFDSCCQADDGTFTVRLSHQRRTRAAMERYHVTVTRHVAILDITIALLPPHTTPLINAANIRTQVYCQCEVHRALPDLFSLSLDPINF